MLALLVLLGFVLATLAPLLHRLFRGATGVVLALYPAATFVILLLTGEKRESWNWISELGLAFSFHLDGLSLLFGLLISGIGTLICLYANAYFKNSPLLGKFFAFLLLFMASMLGVVLSDNLLALFIFWEGTSISSFLLIGWKHENEKSRRAALQGLLTTGGGALALLAGFVLIGLEANSFELSEISRVSIQNSPLYGAILILVALGAFTKSAQFPFHFWLPGAMEAPTPVSAYLHSATMVKAGIYLLARVQPLLGGTAEWANLLTFAGGATMVVAAILAIFQSDLKRLLAYSTLAALGTLTLLLGLGTEHAFAAFAVFLTAHALYKGALFMVAGAVDHETGTRDLHQLGGLARLMPFSAAFGLLAALSLAGAGPFLAFIGKELMFEAALESAQPLLWGIALGAGASFAGVAALVALRPFFSTKKETPKPAHEAPLLMWIGPAILASLGLIFGLLPALVSPLLGDVASSIAGEPVKLKLALWHGLNAALGLSALSLVFGALAFVLWPKLNAWFVRNAAKFDVGPTRWYEFALVALAWLARRQTQLFQNGYLRAYVTTIVLVTLVLLAPPLLELWARVGVSNSLGTPMRFYEALIVVLIALGALVATRSRSRLASLAALGVVGFCVALFYLFFGGPDLAMTQVLVDTLSVILFVLVFFHLPGFARLSSRFARARDALVAGAFGALMTGLVLTMNSVPRAESISPFFAANSVPVGQGRNVVNVILVDFRAIDTLGEITVLSLAAIGVFSLLRLRLQPNERTTTRKNLVSDVFAEGESEKP